MVREESGWKPLNDVVKLVQTKQRRRQFKGVG